ncbi:AAA family ATPase, partial [Staphylococcus warneri]
AITSILAMNPDIVILDEPTAGLDPKSRDQIMKMIKKLQVEQNKTIILVTHEMNDVAKYVDEIKIMKQGQLVEECSPRKLFSDTNYVN